MNTNRKSSVLTLFYDQPRITILVVSLILVAGLSSYGILPRMEDPLLTERAAMVNTLFPGADAERVEALITEKLEEELQDIDEIKELRSTSRAGISTLIIELRDDVYEVDTVWSRVRDKLSDAEPELPAVAMAPEFEQIDVKAYALIVALKWNVPDTAPDYAILRRLARQLEDQLEAVKGTEDVELFGDPDEEILVEVELSKLAGLGLTVQDLARQIGASDAKSAAGLLRGETDLLLEVDGEFDSLDRIGRTPIRFDSEGRFVMLSDVATIRKAMTEPVSSLAIVDGQPAVALGAMVRPGMRVDTWSNDAVKTINSYSENLPSGISLTTVFEQNKYVATRLSGLLWNLLFGGLAVGVVILFMMGWRSALIVSSALPLSALMVLAGMRLLEIPIHQMSVTGLIVALGLLIDNAIVVVDEVSENLRSGKKPTEAVRHGVSHLAIPLLGSTITTALAFAPIALMPGPAGEFVGSIAVSVILAIFSSLFLALTIVPSLTAMGIRIRDEKQTGWLQNGVRFSAAAGLYRKGLNFFFSRPVFGILFGLILPAIGFLSATTLPEQFFPPADRDQFQIEVDLPAQTSLAETTRTVQAIRAQLLENDDISAVNWFLGESAPSFYYNLIPKKKNTSNYAQALVQVEAGRDVSQLIRDYQVQLDQQFPSARVLVRQLEQGPPFDAPIEIRLFGPDRAVLRDLGDRVRLELSQLPDVIHTRSDFGETVAKVSLTIPEEDVRLAGLDYEQIAAQLNASLEGAVGGSILESTEELPVRVRVANKDRADLGSIISSELISSESRNRAFAGIPLSVLAKATLKPESSAITRLDGRRMNEVQGYLVAGKLPAVTQKQFTDRLQQLDENGEFSLPDGYVMEFGGESAKRDDAVGNLMASVSVLMVMTVATLVLSFSSFRMAGIIGAVAALSAGLGVGALWLFGYPFGFMAIVGTMGLIGVAINDSIVVLAAIREDEAARSGEPHAVEAVVFRSTRHVVATTLTTIAGFIPLLLGGGGFWPPLAVTIAGGVAGATILALFFGPSAYILAMCPKCREEREPVPHSAAELSLPAPIDQSKAYVPATEEVPHVSA